MLEKLLAKFAKLNFKQLKTLCIISATMIIVQFLLGLIGIQLNLAIIVVPSAFFFVVSAYMLWIKYDDNKRNIARNKLLEGLKLKLSKDEYTEVQFLPDLMKFIADTRICYEDDNLVRALRILKNLDVKHFAKFDDNYEIDVIAKDKDGNIVDNDYHITPSYFEKNYKIL